MSAEFKSNKAILVNDLFDGRFLKYNIYEHQSDETFVTNTARFLTDGINYLAVFSNGAGKVTIFSRSGYDNDVNEILNAISKEFEAEIYNDSEPQFWGFSSQEEWDEWQLVGYKKDQDEFNEKVINFITGNEIDFRGSKLLETNTQIAKDLVSKTPNLISPENREFLLKSMNQIFSQKVMDGEIPYSIFS